MRRLSLGVALFLSATLLLLTGCDDKPKETAVKIYKSVEECRVDHSEQECASAFENAQNQHVVQAPRSSLDECIAKYGLDHCERHSDSSGNWFGPAMTGFVIGHMLSDTRPVYVDRSGSAYSGTQQLGTYRPCVGDNCNRSGGFISVAPGTASSWSRNYSTTTIRPSGGGFTASSPMGKGPSSVAAPSAPSVRGGFGGSAAGMSAGG